MTDDRYESGLQTLEHSYKRLYTAEAPSYDLKRFSDHKGRLYAQHTSDLLVEVINRSAPREQQPMILDVATGTGRAALALAGTEAVVVGIDLVHAMVKEAHSKAQRLRLPRIHFSVASAARLPFSDATFDAIVCLRFFHLIPRHVWGIIIDEMLRVLRPNGIVVLEFVNPFYGIVGALYRRVLNRRAPNYLWPFELRRLCGTHASIRRTVGTYFPLAQALALVSPRLAHGALHLSRYFPLRHIASEKWYVVSKRCGDGSM